MTDTVNNGIPFVPENTTDPAAGLNQSLLTIDMLLNLAVESIGDTAPPATVLDGARYIVGVSATGAWSGHDNQLAMWIDNPGYWIFRDAYLALNKSDNTIYSFSTTWNPSSISASAENIGSGYGIFSGVVGESIQLKSILAGSGIEISSSSTELTIKTTESISSGSKIIPSIKSDLTYRLSGGDEYKVIEMTSSSQNYIEIPTDSIHNFDIGTNVLITQAGVGKTSIIGTDASVIIRNPHGTASINAQWGTACIRKRAPNEWVLDGNIAEV